ncbi:MAG: esterase-like activity of phytase family protein [Chloroflexota bacterium]
MRLAAAFVLFISAWLIMATALVSAQISATVLTEGLLTQGDLPPGFRGASSVAAQFPPMDGLESRDLAFERDPGPIAVISAVARANDVALAHDVFQFMVESAVSGGVISVPVPLLGDEAAGLSALPSGGSPGAAHRYLFRKDTAIVAITLLGPTGSVTLDDALGLAVVLSARVDRVILASGGANPASTSGISAPISTPPPSRGASTPTPMVAPMARPPVRSATISAEATFDAPTLSGDIQMGGFSGLAALDASGTRFAVLTDRGPNVFFRGRNEAVFAMPEYSPRILLLNVEGETARVTDSIPLRLPDGYLDPVTGTREVSGISTGDHDGPGYTLARERVPYDPNGVDSEGLARDPRDGSFWVADEYGPSILHVSPDGTILQRFVPVGLGLDAPGENVTELLPAAFLKRKANRGFEGLAIAPDGSRVYAIMQSPLSNPSRKDGEQSRVHRIVALDTSGPDVTLQGVYLYLAEEASKVRAPEQDDIKIGDLAAISDTRLLVAERDSREGGPHRMVYAVDIANATNVRSRESVSGKTLEQHSEADLRKANIEPARKDVVVDLARLGFRLEKFEGLAIVDDTTLAITADNDFGLAEADKNGLVELTSVPSRIMIVRLPRSIR